MASPRSTLIDPRLSDPEITLDHLDPRLYNPEIRLNAITTCDLLDMMQAWNRWLRDANGGQPLHHLYFTRLRDELLARGIQGSWAYVVDPEGVDLKFRRA